MTVLCGIGYEWNHQKAVSRYHTGYQVDRWFGHTGRNSSHGKVAPFSIAKMASTQYRNNATLNGDTFVPSGQTVTPMRKSSACQKINKTRTDDSMFLLPKSVCNRVSIMHVLINVCMIFICNSQVF